MIRNWSSISELSTPPSVTATDLDALVQPALEALQQHLRECRDGVGKVIRLDDPETISAELQLEEWIGRGGMQPQDLGRFLAAYLQRVTRLNHPAYAGHQVAVPHPASAVADLVNGVTNNGMAIYEMGPPAVALELTVLRWMLRQVGWTPAAPATHASSAKPATPEGAGGVLTHGGSLANLTAMLAARAHCAPEAWEEGTPSDLIVLAPAVSHYSVARAVSILGLGAKAVWPIEVDARHVVQASHLESLRTKAKAEGRRIMAVIANACSTATGLYDPLPEIGAFCREHDLWFHVDGAHGASALVSPRDRHKVAGIELADSLIWDAHKMLQTSALCAAVLVRRDADLPGAFRQGLDYLVDHSHQAGPDLIHRTVECTKAPLGLKLFLTLATVGEDGMAAHWEHLCDRTHAFWKLISARDGFTCPYEPQSNILCFRVEGGQDLDALQTKLRARVLAEGDFYLTSATVNGRRHLRLTVMNPATDEARISELLDRLSDHARSINGGIC